MVYAVLLVKFSMRKMMLVAFIVTIGACCQAQNDTSLLNRLTAILKFTQAKDFTKIMDYTYPKLFTLAPRDLLIESMKNSFETEEFLIELDSAKIDSIYPVFRINDTSYVKIKHSMIMRMKYTEPFDTTDKESIEMFVNLMAQSFGKENVRFDGAANSINIFMRPDLVGIKVNPSSPWTFVNLDEDNPAMLELLFNRQVLDKLEEFN